MDRRRKCGITLLQRFPRKGRYSQLDRMETRAEASKGFGLLEWTGKIISQGTLVKGADSGCFAQSVHSCCKRTLAYKFKQRMNILPQEQREAGTLHGRP